MSETIYKTAADMAAELGISAQTLKNWTRDFSPYLSPVGAMGDAARRFTDDDVFVLKRIKDHLAAGWTFEETAEELANDGYGNGTNGTGAHGALTVQNTQQGFGVLTDTLRAMVENQQTIQNSMQVNRNLLGVIIQDNFNLKEENAKLRDRMVKMEQEMAELRRRDMDARVQMENRMNRLEGAVRAEANKTVWQKLFGS